MVDKYEEILNGYNLEILTNFYRFLKQECPHETNKVNKEIFGALYNPNPSLNSFGFSKQTVAQRAGGARKRSLKRNRNLKRSTHKRSRHKRNRNQTSNRKLKRSRKAIRSRKNKN